MPTTLILSNGKELSVDEDLEAVSGALNGGQPSVRLTDRGRPIQIVVAQVLYALDPKSPRAS